MNREFLGVFGVMGIIQKSCSEKPSPKVPVFRDEEETEKAISTVTKRTRITSW